MDKIPAYFALIAVIVSLIGTIIGCGIWIGRRQGELVSINKNNATDSSNIVQLRKDLEKGLDELDNKLHRYKTEMQKALTEQTMYIATTYVRKDNLELQLVNIKERQEDTARTVKEIHSMITGMTVKG